MPLPMVHLLLAERIGEKLGKIPSGPFLIGSIAPDAIHVRPGTNRKDKHGTHFFRGKKWDKAEVESHWNLVAHKIECYMNTEEKIRAFATGYCIHTLLDMVWIEQIFNVLAKTLRAGGIGFEDIRTKYYAETNACDMGIYQQSSWTLGVRKQLEAVIPLGMSSLLSAKEVGLWRDIVLGKMQGYENGQPKEVFYITNANIDAFIEELAEKIILFFGEKGYPLL